MSTLVIVAHPNLEQSKINKYWQEYLKANTDVTVHNLYETYPSEVIDVEREQKLVEQHDRIVLQYPFYWYSTPPLLKKWFDSVLTYGWAYGENGNKLHGKELQIALSTGGPKEAYTPTGYNKFSLEELLRPIEATSNLIGTKLQPYFILNGAMTITDEEIQASAIQYAKLITT
ncbi:general stress protein [Bacillus sp. FJAT-27264]|uniref:NAD(P)H-dependent oxidoreductase n=1 Tax=Paenibacillus sp. (strain DSM 101736 / FJAT-27264) TaxID=1850362 RepID=UPI000807C8DD|nr:NAD(P)H-dependent oxidoreductase [Bacillus sp. FJAT-27264]OBZ18067.1 general stress protein [Bacillus sp. FJAT-27264]